MPGRLKGKGSYAYINVHAKQAVTKDNTCALLVSVRGGNAFCSDFDEKNGITAPFFTASVLGLRETFTEVLILIADGLQYHNVKHERPELADDECMKIAESYGAQWWEKHESHLYSIIGQEKDPDLKIGTCHITVKKKKSQRHVAGYEEGYTYTETTSPFIDTKTTDEKIMKFNQLAECHGLRVMRWADWKKNINQTELDSAITGCRAGNDSNYSEAHQAIVNSAEKFQNRQRKNTQNQEDASTHENPMLNFLAEEGPVLALGSKYNNMKFMTYPGDEDESFRKCHDAILKGTDAKEYRQWVDINFVRVNKEKVEPTLDNITIEPELPFSGNSHPTTDFFNPKTKKKRLSFSHSNEETEEDDVGSELKGLLDSLDHLLLKMEKSPDKNTTTRCESIEKYLRLSITRVGEIKESVNQKPSMEKI